MNFMDHGPTRQSLVSFLRHGSKAVISFAALLALATGATALAGENVTYEMEKVTPYEYRGDVRELSRFPQAPAQKVPYVHPVLRPPRTEKIAPSLVAPEAPSMNVPLNAPLAPMPSPTQNFAGMNFSDSCTGGQCGGGWPPDPNGDVGPNHYIQAVNTAYAIYNKTGSLLASFTEDSLWSSVSSTIPCNGNSQGDPIVLYDQLADRWILTHFAFALSGGNPVAPFYQCIAVSKTSDPVSGGWWLYPLRIDTGSGGPPSGSLNDYPKFGIWPDCLYMAANEFNASTGSFVGTAYASLSRSDLESGAALTWSLGFINNTTDPFTMIPSNLLGSSLPPVGTLNYFVSESQTAFAFEVRKFTAGANCGGGGTLSAPANVSQASYNTTPANTNVVPQPNTPNKLDMIDDRLMQKVQYRKIGTAESLWVVHNVISPSTGKVAPQWAQINVTGGTVIPTPVQQQIYTPDSALYRWMGGLAVDSAGNMALGYSTSNGTAPNFPSIAYSGRLAGDAPGTLPQTEVQMTTGAGSQMNKISGTFVSRWGDYSAMSVDPADDCTFWYTNQYYSSQTNGTSGDWQTRIGSFQFCTPASPTVPTVTTTAITGIKSTSATGGGNVIATGGASITARGVCWSTLADPTTLDSHTSDGTGSGIFTSSITGLTQTTAYHVRAYATNSAGTAYGGDVTFTTGIVRPNPPTGLTVQ